MREPKLPENEAGRLATLHSLGILDTPGEDRFDRFTRITARTFDMPIALISLVDRNRQWFKSAVGLDGDETPRSFSFCGHAILEDGVFEVRNAKRDPRFRDNPMVLEQPHVRFYAGAPLEAPNGHKLGTLCIIDSVPRQLSEDEKTKLKNLADMVVGEIMSHVDAETERYDRTAQSMSATQFFDGIPQERGLSVLLFDIDDVLASHDDMQSGVSPGKIFENLLHDYFPSAPSIAHIGNYHFCVLLKADEAFDDVHAINRLCSVAKDALSFADGHESLTPFVGRIEFNFDKYASVADMRRAADGMFMRHEPPQSSDKTNLKRFIRSLAVWRRTNSS